MNDKSFQDLTTNISSILAVIGLYGYFVGPLDHGQDPIHSISGVLTQHIPHETYSIV